MKLSILAMLVAANGFAQGVVDFNNNRAFATAADRLVYDPRIPPDPFCVPLVGTNFVAQLYYGADVSSLQAVTTAPARFRVPTTTAPGTWSGGNRTLVGFTAGMTATLVVRAWDSNFGVTFEQARATGGAWAESAPFTYTVPAAGSPPNAFYMENLRAFGCVPEPSIIGLGCVGAIVLLLLRRARRS